MKALTGTTKYINQQNQIFYIVRDVDLWYWHYSTDLNNFKCSQWFDRKKDCRKDLESKHGKVQNYPGQIPLH